MRIIIITAAAGILGTGLGGVISALLLRKPSEKIMCLMLSLAGGIMTGVVCFSLVPESIEVTNTIVTIIGIILGVLVIMLLNRLVDKFTNSTTDSLSIHQTHEELFHASQVLQNKSNMLRSGVIMLIAIGLHNLPEGIAIGAGSQHDNSLGMILALIIMLHNIPEGMAIAAPLLAGGINRWKVAVATAIAGVPTLIGGFFGMFIGHISSIAIALSLSMASGAMLYIVFGEIIPQSVVMAKSRAVTLVTLLGIILGLAFTLLH